jgi:O-antigen/teichoic acid export membrane protein
LAVIAFTGLGGGVAFFAEPLLRIWSGSDEVAHTAAPVLFWYGLGNAIVGILILPFMLQFARGRLRLHVLGNLIFLVTFVPILIYAARYWGATGAGRVYFASNLLFLFLWVPLVHQHFLPAMVWRWLFRDTLPIVMVMLGVFAIASWALPDARHAPECLAWIGLASLLAVISGLLLGENSRLFAIRFFSLRKQ